MKKRLYSDDPGYHALSHGLPIKKVTCSCGKVFTDLPKAVKHSDEANNVTAN